MNTQPEALRLAAFLDSLDVRSIDRIQNCVSAAAELRRLHEVNTELVEALKALIDMDVAYQRGDKVAQAVESARAAIVKAGVTK